MSSKFEDGIAAWNFRPKNNHVWSQNLPCDGRCYWLEGVPFDTFSKIKKQEYGHITRLVSVSYYLQPFFSILAGFALKSVKQYITLLIVVSVAVSQLV